MRVTRVSARDFRNLERVDATLGEAVTVVHGPNGAGKTNLLEALYFGCTARSCRTSNERELVRFGTKVARVEVELEAEDGGHRLDVGLEPGEAKRVRLDGADLAGPAGSEVRPLVSVFMPDRLDLVKGAPALRRAHLDQLVAALWPARAENRAAYNRALSQRNALIARVRAGGADPTLLDTWDSELARAGATLMADRTEACALVAPRFSERAGDLGLPEEATLSYRPRSRAADAEALREELRERRDDDLQRGFSAHGPHRDEVVARARGSSAARVRVPGPAAARPPRAPLRRARRPARRARPAAADAPRRRDVRARLRSPRAAGRAARHRRAGRDHDDGPRARAGRDGRRRGRASPSCPASSRRSRWREAARRRGRCRRRSRPLKRDLAPATTLARVQEVWPAIAGAAAREATPVSERAGTVTFACRSSVWAGELTLMARDLTDRLNGALEGRPGHRFAVRDAVGVTPGNAQVARVPKNVRFAGIS